MRRVATTGALAPLEAWLIGTGTPIITADRYGPCVALRCGGELMLVDAGNGCLYRLAQLGIRAHEITHIFITHHHVDHYADLAFLLLDAWMTAPRDGGWTAPHVIGPPGMLDYVTRILAANAADIAARVPHGFAPERLVTPVVEISNGVEIDGGGWLATAFEVDHRPVRNAFGYLFRTQHRSLAISGDTRPCDNLVLHARGADVLVHEVLYPGFGIPEYHTSSRDVGDVARLACVGKLVLTHLIPGHLDDELWLRDVRPSFAGETIVGHDLLRIF